ncbi:hypothetical protein [Promicromonospora sp. NPDC023987]|uniref:hypothetical protein n=1 Tax=Promicromonospora sp. NPDC023987 TaxID=3155360 RepID=UPI0033DA5DAA
MNTITSSDALSAHVRGYAQAVRLHLADLGPEVADDLTDGLEADLTEAVLDEAVVPAAPETHVFDLSARFGPADEYAAELRAAAGLPASVPARSVRRGPGRAVAGAWTVASERVRAVWRPVASTPAWTAFAELARSLAPAWWILRGWVAAQVVIWSYGINDVTLWPSSAAGRVLVVAAIVVSVQWGRGKWVPRWSWFPRAVAVASVAAGVLAVPMVLDVEADADPVMAGGLSYDAGWSDGYYNAQISQASTASGAPMAEADGVWVDGMQVSNIFAYDAEGNPIRDVQLFDDRGRPVRTIDESVTWDTWSVPDVAGSWSFQPATASDGRSRWNVFPLSAVPAEELGLGAEGSGFYDSEGYDDPYPQPPTGVRPQDMPWPFLKAPTAIDGDTTVAGSGEADGADEPATGEPSSDEPGTGPAAGDRPMSRTRGETVHPGEAPTSDTELREPTLEATQAD